jgi:hypothetical protein
VHYIGLKGEYAFAKYFNTDINNKHFSNHGDPGYDAVLADGTTVDIKVYQDNLLFFPDRGMTADITVLINPIGSDIDHYLSDKPDQPLSVKNINIVGYADANIYHEFGYRQWVPNQGERIEIEKQNLKRDWLSIAMRNSEKLWQ